MRLSPISAALVLVLAAATVSVSANGASNAVAASGTTPLAVQAKALDASPDSRIEADEAMDSAVAAAVIGAVSTQFGENEVAVKLDSVAVAPASVRDRAVSGQGRLQVGDDATWIPFHFAAQYDTVATTVTYPQLVLGDQTTSRSIDVGSALANKLSKRVGAQLREEFAEQPVRMKLDRVSTSEAGARYLRVSALATADFGAEGATPAQVDALYDRRTGQWLRVAYELGTTSNWADQPVVAAR